MNGRSKCQNCGNMIPIGTPYCVFCGTQQTLQKSQQENTPRRRRNKDNVTIVRTGADMMVPVAVEKKNEPEIKEEKILKEEVKLTNTADTARTEKEDPVKEEEVIKKEDYLKKEKIQEESLREENLREENEKPDHDSEEFVFEEDKDEKPKKISKRERKASKKEEEFKKSHDTFTKLLNRQAFDERIEKLALNGHKQACIIIANINNFERTLAMFGEEDANILTSAVAQSFKAVFGNNCYRTGDDEYAVVLERVSDKTVSSRIEYLRQEMRKKEKELRGEGYQIDMKLAMGYAYGDEDETIRGILDSATSRMEQDKKRMAQLYDPNYDGYYNDVVAEYEELKVKIDRENVHKAVLLLIGAAAFMAYYLIFMI